MTPTPLNGLTGCGVGLKPAHYRDVLTGLPPVGWFEVHPENYMGAGGPPHAYLRRVREAYPLSLHGVGLSIGGAERPDRGHLDRLKALAARYEPALVSEHLAWSSHRGRAFNDLLALPYTAETLNLVCGHVAEVQDVLGRAILLENPSTYVLFRDSALAEPEFIAEVVRRTGCGLLLDVNNLHVSCANHGWDAEAYLAALPLERVGEIHLAGHAEECEADGGRLLIDTHDRPVADPVWDLFARVLAQTGPVPVLVEWDQDVPDWPVLFAEAERARGVMESVMSAGTMRHVA